MTRQTIYLWIDHGLLQAEKLNGVIRIPRESIMELRMASRVEKNVL